MALAIGNILGAVTNLTTATGKEKSVKSFLKTISEYGVQVKNNFEVNFSGIGDLTFFIQDISLPGITQNFTQIYYDGKEINVPTSFDYDHEITMTVLNDANGYIYSVLANFLLGDISNTMVNSGYTMTIKALAGDTSGKYKGSLITCYGVRLSTISGLSFGQGQNDISTFDITFKAQNFVVTPGGLQQAAGVLGTVGQLIG